ncbi:MAG TPA: energy transducer TonB [Flavobacteriales bacterium]
MPTLRNLSHAAGLVLSIASANGQPIPKAFGERVFDALKTGEVGAFDPFLPTQGEFATAALSLPPDTVHAWRGLIGADVYERKAEITRRLQDLLGEGRAQGIRWTAIVWIGARQFHPAVATIGPGKGAVERCALSVLFQHQGFPFEARFPANINAGKGWRFTAADMTLKRVGDHLTDPDHWVPMEHVEVPIDAVAPYDVADDVHLRMEADAGVDPLYPGGDTGFDRQLAERIQWPPGARAAEVRVSYVVGTDGAISDIRIEQGASADLDAAVLAALRLMPPYAVPAKEHGVPVRIRTTRTLKLHLP